MAGARASRWGRYIDYSTEANLQICLLVQIESVHALSQLEAIANVEGVDGVFIGPADLSASMGFNGKPSHPEVQAAVEDAIVRIVATGKAAGILTPDTLLADRYISLGARFVAVGLDTTLLVRGMTSLTEKFGLNTPQVQTVGAYS